MSKYEALCSWFTLLAGMISVKSLIERWCEASFRWVHSRLCGAATEAADNLRAISAERVVETAAFLKLAAIRKCQGAQSVVDWPALAIPIRSIQPIVDSCPLDEQSSVEILGSIHELFVNKRDVLSRTSSRRHSLPRKTGGVFYTPPHVIEYIVRHTVGCVIEKMGPEDVERVSILDPASGSGAFLLATYRFLVQWHLNWYRNHQPENWPKDIVLTTSGWELTPRRLSAILVNNIFGVDLDDTAIDVAGRTLWLTRSEFCRRTSNKARMPSNDHRFLSNLKHGNTLIGSAFDDDSAESFPSTAIAFRWAHEFPRIKRRGGFDVILGNPPYRRERNFKQQLEEIRATSLGRYHAPRMDLWYYFVHRGIQLLRQDGVLSFITNAYWTQGTGADKLIASLKDDVHLDELFLLRDCPIFPGVAGHHLILRLTKAASSGPTTIKSVPEGKPLSLDTIFARHSILSTYSKTREQLFRGSRLDVRPSSDRFLSKLGEFPRLIDLAIVRQGIAENPATINQRTLERFRDDSSAQHWRLNEGVFSLQAHEVGKLALSSCESQLLRPYHDLCDLGRYWMARIPSRNLIYSTRVTCPAISEYPRLKKHLARFRSILNARRETRAGSNQWWHLHWPRDERIWKSPKIVAIQMAARPSFVPARQPTYVPFSTNVIVPAPGTREDLRYLCGLLNSRVLWAWFSHHAKRRGIGLELNGHVLEQAPIRRIDFQNAADIEQHNRLVALVQLRIRLEQKRVKGSTRTSAVNDAGILECESQIDALVARLYRLDGTTIPIENESAGMSAG